MFAFLNTVEKFSHNLCMQSCPLDYHRPYFRWIEYLIYSLASDFQVQHSSAMYYSGGVCAIFGATPNWRDNWTSKWNNRFKFTRWLLCFCAHRLFIRFNRPQNRLNTMILNSIKIQLKKRNRNLWCTLHSKQWRLLFISLTCHHQHQMLYSLFIAQLTTYMSIQQIRSTNYVISTNSFTY